jgi:GNAT superfamily N-acetyltransferase
MAIPFNMKRMIDTELHYPQRFANMQQKDYGLIFFNEGNKASLESNHAVITDHIGIESSIRNIESFYKAKGIKPCIFSALKSGELDKLADILCKHGFGVQAKDHEYYLHDHESSLRPSEDLHIQRIKQLDIDLMETIALEYGGDWTIKVVERHLQHPSYHLLGGFHEGELASLASVSTYAGYSRVSDVFTREKFRGKGYAGAMIHYLVNYHRGISQNHLYLFSDHPGTTKIIEKGGFSRLPHDFSSWVAIKDM